MEIQHATDIKRGEDFSVLIYAQPGVGKTSTLRYLPGRTLVIDVDRTTNVLAGVPNVDVVKLDTKHPLEGARSLLGEIYKTQLSNYDNIAFDNISEFEQAWLGEKANEAKTKSGADMGIPQMNDYNQFGFYLPDMIRFINSWPGVNKVYTAWETTRQIDTPTGQTYNQFVPQMREKLVTNVMGLMNVVGRMVISDKTGARGFILKPSNAAFAKNQLDDRQFALPETLFTEIGGDVNVSTPSVPDKASQSGTTGTSKGQ
ncbi:AAA family ATPase [Levilactobacillus andaensis]|uniref:AAA family ATPase n=1 Tax=Levilactobacillus andaensis TaxID=2799570 RepID=UPI0019454F01|nr:AAA family ATPase [Levilactobacillus andaensis]